MSNPLAGGPAAGVSSNRVGPGTDEATLVEGCRRGDPESLRGLMALHGGRVMSLIRSVVGDEMTAEALAQEAFLKVFRSMDKFKPGSNLRAWLLTIARNTAYDHLRREKSARLRPVDLGEVAEPADPREGPAEDLVRKEDRGRMRKALENLPAREREVVRLRVYEELTWDAISETLGIPEATGRARMNRALERLRSALRSSS